MTGIATLMMMLAFFSLSSLSCQGQKPNKLLFKYEFFLRQKHKIPWLFWNMIIQLRSLQGLKIFSLEILLNLWDYARDLMDEIKEKRIIKFIMKGIMEKWGNNSTISEFFLLWWNVFTHPCFPPSEFVSLRIMIDIKWRFHALGETLWIVQIPCFKRSWMVVNVGSVWGGLRREIRALTMNEKCTHWKLLNWLEKCF